ncbi:MAG: cbb3-type cytochrome c oxidase N-terminal domain-containing protein [Cyclonatronaceae bacterium]
MEEKDKNLIFDDEHDKLLNHEYDGIQELDNPMPPWWLYGFYFTIALAVVYLLWYDVLGIGPSQTEEYQRELAAAEERFGTDPGADPGAGTSVDYATLELLTDQASLEAGRTIYNNPAQLCVTCHGANAQGLVGPDLTNDYWLHGCDLESIMTSVKTGYPQQGMPPYGSGNRLSDEELQQLASYIISLRGSEPEGAKSPDMSRAEQCEI